MRARNEKELDSRQLAELSALADGTLPEDRREEVRRRVAASPQMAALLAREQAAVDVLHQARDRDHAPAGLRARIDAQRAPVRVRGVPRLALGGGTVAALAVIALALVLVLPGGAPGAPSVSQAAVLAYRGPAAPAPAPDPRDPRARLAVAVGQVSFPNWASTRGYRVVGQRSDRLAGHRAVTVYYQWHGRQIAYTIVDPPTLAVPAGRATNVRGLSLHTLSIRGRTFVTWRERGDTCILSGATRAELQDLAGYQPH